MPRLALLALLAPLLVAAAPASRMTPPAGSSLPAFTAVRPAVPLAFPRDHGAHPGFRTEWWYATGWLTTASGRKLGFQVTFFRVATGLAADNPSAFAPRQIIFAHAGISDPAIGRLRHGQRIGRAGFGLVQAASGDAALVLDDWRMTRRPDGVWTARAAAADFALDLSLAPTQPLLLQGERGYSRKGPDPASASHYYSIPQLRVSGRVRSGGRVETVTGTAWLDREWSSALLDTRATGWDWLGLNMDDGGALTLFRVRGKAATAAVWAGGSWRSPAGVVIVLQPGDVRFRPGRVWRSPRTGTVWPVAPVVEVRLGGAAPGGWRRFAVAPLLADQELDSRAGGGPVYWEGAVTVPGGRGYLELTGYGSALRL